jgi:hypothetical protein
MELISHLCFDSMQISEMRQAGLELPYTASIQYLTRPSVYIYRWAQR